MITTNSGVIYAFFLNHGKYDDLEHQIGLRKYTVVGSYDPLFPISIQSAIDDLQL